MPKRARSIFSFVLTLCMLAAMVNIPVYAASDLSGTVLEYSNYWLEDKSNADIIGKIHKAGNLYGRTSTSDAWLENNGWFEYQISVAKAGTYELILTYDPQFKSYPNPWIAERNDPEPLAKHEYIIDGSTYLNPFPKKIASNKMKVSNVFLTEGNHTFRIQRMSWEGLHAIQAYEFKPVTARELSKNLRVTLDPNTPYGGHGGGHYLKIDETFNMNVYSAGKATGKFEIEVFNKETNKLVKSYLVDIKASDSEVGNIVKISASEPGTYYLKYKANGEYVPAAEGLLDEEFIVLDSTPVDTAGSLDDISKTLIKEINCVTSEPDYSKGNGDTEFGGVTRVVNAKIGSYRETGNWGYLPDKTNPDYIAYKLPVMDSSKQYLIEVEYPDDAVRNIAIAIKEEGNNTIAGGVETGREYVNTNTFQTFAFHYYPINDNTQPRLVIESTAMGLRAAVSRIRVYEVNGLPMLKTSENGRDFGFFYEEGINFKYMFGAASNTREEYEKAAERWAKGLRYLGANVMMPTVGVYQQQLYPSRNYDKFQTSIHQPDYFKMLAIYAEKYGLKIIGDFHRASNDMTLAFKYQDNPRRNWAVDKNGNYFMFNNDETYSLMNPIYPDNQAWLEGWVREFVNRYKDLKSFAGISIRSMGWQNPGLNNFNSLDFGYDDYTGKLFSEYLGIADPGTPTDRYATFTSEKNLQKWIDWRISKIDELYTKLADIAKSAREDITVYSFVDNSMSNYNPELLEQTGIRDNNIDGFKYIYGVYQYGRKSFAGNPDDAAIDWDRWRSYLTESVDTLESSRAVAPWGHYMEDGGLTASPTDIGLGEVPWQSWISAQMAASGRSYLEKYALALAETDANLLINGGNQYFFDQPVTREFMAEYRQLPREKFNLVNSKKDPIVVRDYFNGKDYYFYIVNRTNTQKGTQIDFGQERVFTQLSTGKDYKTTNGKLIFKLEPFQLMVFKAKASTASVFNPYTPAAPGALTASSNSFNQVNLAWNDNSYNEEGFIIERKDGTDSFKVVGKTAANVAAYTDKGLSPKITYEYRVKAFNTLGDSSEYSDIVTAKSQFADNVGLIAQYKLDETSGKVVADSTSHGYDGKLYNGESWNKKGYVNGTLSFDGVNDYIDAGKNVGTADKLTVAFWMRADKVAMMEPVNKLANDDSAKGWAVRIRDNGSIWFTLGSEKKNWGPWVNANTYKAGKWIHVACTYENNIAKIYINGQLGVTEDLAKSEADYDWLNFVPASGDTVTPLTIGRYSAYPGFYFDGKLDDVRIYDVALSADEIAAVANITSTLNPPKDPGELTATATGDREVSLQWKDNSTNELGFIIERKVAGSTAFVEAGRADAGQTTFTDTRLSPSSAYVYRICATNDDGESSYTDEVSIETPAATKSYLAGYWKFDETEGEIAADSSGNGFDGTLVNKPKWRPGEGVVGGAIYFDGNSYVDAGKAAGNTSKTMTVSFWMNAEASDYLEAVNKIGADGSGKGWAIKLRNAGEGNNIWFRVGDENKNSSPRLNTTPGYEVGKWTYVTCTFDSGTAKLYINGVLNSTTHEIIQTPDNLEAPLVIGTHGPWKAWGMKGLMDELRIYDIALTDAQVSELYSQTAAASAGGK